MLNCFTVEEYKQAAGLIMFKLCNKFFEELNEICKLLGIQMIMVKGT